MTAPGLWCGELAPQEIVTARRQRQPCGQPSGHLDSDPLGYHLSVPNGYVWRGRSRP